MAEFKNRTGETNTNKQGLKMTIDVYINANQVKIRFEDDYVSNWTSYSKFKEGKVLHPYFVDGKVLSIEEMAKKKVGEIRENRLGQYVTITAFRGFDDIDVKISNGVMLTGVTYKDFKNRVLADQNLQSKIGETVTTRNNGIQKIIAYNSYDDISIEFEDGTIREHVRYDHFREGKIAKREWGTATTSHLGEITTNDQGLQAKIICYNSEKDIIVKFKNGDRVRTTYTRFKSGTFKNPNVNNQFGKTMHTHTECLEERQGMSSLNKYGEMMKIVNYKGVNDVDVLFEDGTLVKGVTFRQFKKGTLKNPNAETVNRDTILEDPSMKEEQSKAEEQSLTKEPLTKESSSVQSSVKEPPLTQEQSPEKILSAEAEKRIGEVNVNHDGEKMKIIAYRNSLDIDVEFEDGSIKKFCRYYNFKSGKITKPKAHSKQSLPQKAEEQKEQETGREIQVMEVTYKITHIGETHLNNAGENMEIVDYKNAHDVTVQFDDGSVRDKVNYYNFLKGTVSKVKKTTKPSGKANDSTQLAAKRIGETRLNAAGESMTIIEYFTYRNITVQFGDGTVRKNVSYYSFCTGRLKNPKNSDGSKVESTTTQSTSLKQDDDNSKSDSKDSRILIERIGEERLNTAGERMKIVDYQSCNNITVQFEDGTTRSGVKYAHFNKGLVRKSKTIDGKAAVSKVCEEILYKTKPQNSFLYYAEAYRLSAKTLDKETNSIPIASIMLCKKAVIDYLRFVTETTTDDIRLLGRQVREVGIDIDPRDLAWLHDFTFEIIEDDQLKPTVEDANLAIKIVDIIRGKVSSRE